MSLPSGFADEFSRRFNANRTAAIEVYSTLRDFYRAMRSVEICQLFPSIEKRDIALIISNLMKYPRSNPCVREISSSRICLAYVTDRWKDAGHGYISSQSVLAAKIRTYMGRQNKNQSYRYVKDSQIVPTALYFIHKNRDPLLLLIEKESKRSRAKSKALEPLIRDLSYVTANPLGPVERKA
jgi:hypothetical protein